MKKSLFVASVGLSLFVSASDWKDSLVQYLPLHDSMIVRTKDQGLFRANYTRESIAFGPDFKLYRRQEPRFIRGGLLLENGSARYHGTGNFFGLNDYNYLSAEAASLDVWQDGKPAGVILNGGKSSKTKGVQNSALRFSGTLDIPEEFTLKVPRGVEPFFFSFYAKGAKGAKIRIATLEDKETGASEFVCDGTWQRFFHVIPVKVPLKKCKFRITAEQEVELDAMMLEGAHQYYFARQTPSSWIPGRQYRAGDRLSVSMPTEDMTQKGAVSVRAAFSGYGQNNLFSNGNGHNAQFLLKITNNGTRLEGRLWGKNFKVKMPGTDTALWKENLYLLTWDAGEGRIFVNGEPAARIPLAGAVRNPFDVLYFSGTAAPDAVLSDVAFWTCSFSPEEAKAMAQTLLTGLIPDSTLELMTPAANIARDQADGKIIWRAKKQIASSEASIDGFKIPVNTKVNGNDLECSFNAGLLSAGNYVLTARCNYTDGTKERVFRNFTVVPARIPWENTQVCAWFDSRVQNRDFGATIGGCPNINKGLVDQLTGAGMYAMDGWWYFGEDDDFDTARMNRARTISGKVSFLRIRDPHVRKTVEQFASNISEHYRYSPNIKMALMGTEETAGSCDLDFSPDMLAYAQKTFGFDMKRWTKDIKRASWDGAIDSKNKPLQHPLGRLGTAPIRGTSEFPSDGVVKADNPFYAFQRWWHSAEGGSEVVSQDIIAEKIKEVRPDFLSVREPIMRRPAYRSYRKITVAQDWSYYADPKNMLICREGLEAQVRGFEGMIPSAMPQFLLKPGMAAPYDGMPTADMLKEAVWLVCSRPTRLLTFWQFAEARNKAKMYSAEEMRKLLNNPKNWKEAEKADLRLHAENPRSRRQVFAPGIGDAQKYLSQTLWQPFGGLMPRWKNAPRRVALISSVASHLFGDIRWTSGGFLEQELLQSGIPYDVILDDDMLDEAFSFDQYELVAFPFGFALPEAGMKKLRHAMEKGTILAVDSCFKMESVLPGARMFKKAPPVPVKPDRAAAGVNDKLYIEKMQAEEQARQKLVTDSSFRNLVKTLKTLPVTCETPDVVWNMLTASGADYLAVVNDLRVPGELYGHLGKVRENGKKQTAVFRLPSGKYKYAWDLVKNQEIRIENDTLTLELPAAEGTFVMFGQAPAGTLAVTPVSEVKRGTVLKLKAEMKSPGLVPVRITVSDPDGIPSDFSCWTVMENGKLIRDIPFAVNGKTGTWKISVQEFLKGTTSTIKVKAK